MKEKEDYVKEGRRNEIGDKSRTIYNKKTNKDRKRRIKEEELTKQTRKRETRRKPEKMGNREKKEK